MSFNITVRFGDGLSDAQKAAFETAALRWSQIIVGDLPSAVIDGETIDDLLIDAQGTEIDGAGRILGQAGPRFVRTGSLMPVTGIMEFDTADLARIEADGSLVNVIVHEMGHVLGIGTLWEAKGLLQGGGTDDPTFIGSLAQQIYAELLGEGDALPVPVENTGGPGTRDGHWRESIFINELMTGFLNAGVNPLSLLTIASLEDMGYEVDREAADQFDITEAPSFEAVQVLHTCAMLAPEWEVVP